MELLNSAVSKVVPSMPKYFVRKVASRYIAGQTLTDVIRTARELNRLGAMTTIDLLGEHSDDKQHAIDASQTYIDILNTIKDNNLDSNVSLKPTHLGLTNGPEFCIELIERIVKHAKELGNFVRIDMEDTPFTDDTLAMFYTLKEEYDNVGIVIQAYLRRTLADAEKLADNSAGVRLCKGIYREDHSIAYHDKNIIIKNFALVLRELLSKGSYVGIATHCEQTVWEALRIIHELKLKRDQYEFQMLLGVTEDLRSILINAGHRLRVYVPYGEEWYPYSMRRLKENPKIGEYIMRDFLGMKSG